MDNSRVENRRLTPEQVVSRLPRAAEPFARLVGAWVWIEFPRKPDPETLRAIKELGFHWNRKREAWQHPCGCFVKRPARRYDPRNVYPTMNVSSLREFAAEVPEETTN